jgi:stearoyl-CoA desaturase (delta-9 desaturase)
MARATRNADQSVHDDIVYPSSIPFVLLHLACFAAIWTGVTWQAALLCVGLYLLRIFAIGAGYHRYFSHRAYSTSRVFQFVLAFLAQTSTQKSVLWWASKHRHHHLHSDTEEDVHSPRRTGFFYAHLGWIFSRRHDQADLVKVADLVRYPELMWLNRFELLPAFVLGIVAFLIGGWPGLVVGFVWSTVLVYHATFSINSLAHLHGRKRYVTGDDSRNNWWLAIITMGEGWHNNHHAFQSSVRQGFRWWEVDVTFYILTAMSWCGIVWDLKTPPEAVLRNEQRLGARVTERVAAELAASFNIEPIAEQIATSLRNAVDHAPGLIELRNALAAAHHRAADLQQRAVDLLATVRPFSLPSRADIRMRAAAMLAKTRSLDDIVERAHRMILDKVCERARLVFAEGNPV